MFSSVIAVLMHPIERACSMTPEIAVSADVPQPCVRAGACCSPPLQRAGIAAGGPVGEIGQGQQQGELHDGQGRRVVELGLTETRLVDEVIKSSVAWPGPPLVMM